MDRRDRAVRRLRLRHPRVQLRTRSSAQERHRLGLSRVESQGGCLRELRFRNGRARRPAAPRNRNRGSARAGSLLGPHPCHYPLGSLQGRRCRRWTGRAGGECRGADRRSAVVDRGLEDGARRRFLTGQCAATALIPTLFWRNPMSLDQVKSSRPSLARAIAQRTRGRTQGAITRLMSPSDFGQILKPFVFLDLFDHEGSSVDAGLHPHSGIATLTSVADGAVSYITPENVRGTLPAGGVEWMQAGRGMWHGGALDNPSRTRGFQLWIALPPQLELGPTVSIYQSPKDVPEDGSARVLLGRSARARSRPRLLLGPHVAGRASRCRGAHLVDQKAPCSRRPSVRSKPVTS